MDLKLLNTLENIKFQIPIIAADVTTADLKCKSVGMK
jgi:hypothetical protein